MFLKAVTIIFLSIHLTVASSDCDGSELNIDGFVQSPQKNKAGLGEFPWTVALYRKDASKPHCAGSIIDEMTIITTAFCVSK